jgi:hypothetical protein
VLQGTANPDGRGLLLRGREYEPVLRSDLAQGIVGGLPVNAELHAERRGVGGPPADLDPFVVGVLVRLARLAGSVADALRECPDPAVRRSAAILAARAHPLRAAFDD